MDVDDDFFNLNNPIEPVAVSENTSFPSQGSIIKRVFHTRTEFRIYPDGKVFPEKTQSWFEDHVYEVKKKEKVKPKEIKLEIGKTEEY